MFRKLASVIVSLAIGLSPLSASAEGFVFRYKMGASTENTPPVDPGFEIGNDIQAWFVAPVGYPFLKQIPVATRKITDWERSSGSIPAGITLDTASGILSGKAEREEKTETTWFGRDATGNRIARAQMHFSAFEPVGQVTEVNWYMHTGEYFYKQIPAPAGVDVVRWVPIVDLPEGMGTRNGAFDGRPAKAGTYGLAWRGYDYLEREVAFTYGEFLVQDGPVVEMMDDQTVDKSLGHTFNLQASVKHSVGELSYALKPVKARPSGVLFWADSGRIGGVFDDFNTSAKFEIEARDGGTGRVGRSNEFTLATLPEALDLNNMPELHAVAGYYYIRGIARTYSGAKFDLIEGALPEGIKLDRETGYISGTPVKPETQEGLKIELSGDGVIPAVSNTFKFRVFSAEFGVTTEPVHARVGTAFRTLTPAVLSGEEPPYTYVPGSKLPEGILFDATVGQYHSEGIAVPGTYDQRIGVINGSNRGAAAMQEIRIYDHPTLGYMAREKGQRFGSISIAPQLKADSIRNPASFKLVTGKLPPFLKLHSESGVIDGTTRAATDIGSYGPFVVSLVDGFGERPVLSNAFMIDIEERKSLEITQILDGIQRWVPNQKKAFDATSAIEGITYSLKTRGALPVGLDISPDGRLLGTTDDPVGTVYSGIVVHAVDGTGFEDELEVSFKVVEPDAIGGIDGGLNKTYAWTVGRDFIDLMVPRVANAYGKVSYEFDANTLGLAVDPATLALKGNAPTTGTFEVGYLVSDETDRAPVRGVLTFVIQPDMSVVQADAEAFRGAQTSVAPLRANGVAPFDWKIVSGNLPGTGAFPAMQFNRSTGEITGKPRVEGDYPLVLEVVDATMQTKRVSFNLKVMPPQPFSFSYPNNMMTLGWQAYVQPEMRNQSEAVIWNLVSGTLPSGVEFSTSGPARGMFQGIPLEDGVFEDIVVTGRDSGTGEEWTETVTLRVQRYGSVSLPGGILKHRAGGKVGKFGFAATNITEPAVYEIVDNAYPSNVSINPASGELSASFPLPGKYPVVVKVTDLFGREASAVAVLDILGELSVTSQDPARFKRFNAGSVPLTVRNLIGKETYVSEGLPSTLKAADGAISGTPEVVESRQGVTVTLTDSYDGASATSNPFSLVVSERDTLTLSAPDYQQNQYKQVDYRPTIANAIGPVAWSISPALPSELVLDPATGRISGTMDTLFSQSFTLTATDSKGAPLGQAAGSFNLKVVEREKPAVANPSTLGAILDQPINTTLYGRNVLGTAVWEHVSGNLPTGVEFDAANHRFIGTPTQFGVASNILIRITDTYRGIVTVGESLLSIDVRQDGTPIGIVVDDILPFRVGESHHSGAPSASNTVGDVTWYATGLDGTGLSIDPATGIISGTPTVTGDVSVVIGVKDVTGRERALARTVRVMPPLEIEFPQENALLYNYTLERLARQSSMMRTAAAAPRGRQPHASNTYGTTVWSISPATGLPAGLVFNTSTGEFMGKPLQIGEFGPFVLTLRDSLPGQAVTTNVRMVVTMNDDPIDLDVGSYVTKVGYAIRTADPVFDNALGNVRFFPENNDLGGTNLKIDTNTGVLTGSFASPQDRNINIAIADEFTTRVTSRPLHLQVLPRLLLTGPQKATLDAQAPINPVIVTPTNVAGTVVWQDLDAAQKALLPEGIEWDPTAGTFVGQTDVLGTFGPFKVKAEDRFHGQVDAAQSNDMLLEVKVGSTYLKLKGAAMSAGQKLKPYSWNLGEHLTMVGVDASQVSWTWAAPSKDKKIPGGLYIDQSTGRVMGTPTEAGDYEIIITAHAKGRSSSAAFTLHLEPPLFELELADPGNLTAVSWQQFSYDIRNSIKTKSPNIDVNGISWKVITNPVPSRIAQSGTTVYGTFTHAGDYVFKVQASYTLGSDTVVAETDLVYKVTDIPEVAWRYWSLRFTGNAAGAFEFTGSPSDIKIAEIQMFDTAGNLLTPVDAYAYYNNVATTKTVDERGPISTWKGTEGSKKAWDGDPSTFMTDGLGSGIIIEFPTRVVVGKVRLTMTGTPQDLVNIQSMRSNVEGWCGNCGWLQHSSDYQPLPKPANGTAYAAGEVIEFRLWPGTP